MIVHTGKKPLQMLTPILSDLIARVLGFHLEARRREASIAGHHAAYGSRWRGRTRVAPLRTRAAEGRRPHHNRLATKVIP
jgi:hypothetical protein